MGLRDKIQKKFQETLTVRHRRERPSSVPPPKKQSVGGASSPNFSSPQDESLHRTGRRMSTGNAGIPEAPLPVSEPNLTAPMLISPKGSLTGELGEAAVPPSPGSPTSVVSVPHVMLSVEDIPSLSVTGSTDALEQSATTGEPPLWRQAFDELSEDDKEVFQSAEAREPGIVDDVVRMAEESKVACQQSQLKFRFRGKDIVVRDVAYKLITWVDKFKAVGDTAIQYDPVHAALPWAGVRFLLQIAVNQKESMEAVLVGLEQVVIPLVRCAIYEKLYLSPALSLAEQLKIVLKELYLAILKFLAYAKRYLEKSTAQRVCEGLLESEGKSLFDEVERQDSRIQREIAAAEMELRNQDHTTLQAEARRLQQILTSLNEPIIRTDQTVACMYEQFQDYEKEKKRGEILRWLSQVEYEKHHKQAKSGLLDNTGVWLLEAEEFRDWRCSSASGILWLRGLVGAGKTKLVCQVIGALQARERGDEPVVYFYFNRNDPQRRDPTALLQAIVKQLSVAFSGLPKPVVAMYDKRQERGHAEGTLDWEECRDLIVILLDIYPQTTVVIDALDECDLDKRWILFDALQAMTGSSGLVKIFVSSRDETDIRRGLEQIPYLFIDARKNTTDISRFVRRDVTDSLRRGRFLATVSEELKEKIISTIAGQANGMFQWAALQIHQLYAITLAVDIEKTLGKLPATLEQAYDQIWTTIRDGGQFAYQLVTRALMWVLCSMRPLHMEEWAKASYPPADYPSDGSGATTLLGLCRNLVIWDSQLDRMSFAHLSVQEYLEARIFDIIQAHSMAAQSCLSYLTHPNHALNGGKRQDSVREWTFENYVLMWWGYHFQRAFNGEQRMSDQVREHLQEFLGTSTKPGAYYCKWLENVAVICAGFDSRTHLDTECYYLRSIPPNPLFAMSFYNFGGELEQHWELDAFNANCENLAREPLLQVAIVRGNQWAVEYLCSKGADVNAVINCRSLLMLAIDLDRGAVLCSLLDRGAKIDAVDGVYPTLLHAAASRGGTEVVEAILARGADISEAVILAAAENKHHGPEVMKLLLSRDTKIHTTEAAVVAALAKEGNGLELVELLFDREPSLQVPDEVVVAALRRNDFQVVEAVLSRNPEISEGVLSAVAASVWGIELITKLLLTSDAKFQITGAVMAAVMESWAAVMESWAAVRESWAAGPELIDLLCDRNPSLQVPDAAVVAAARSAHGLQTVKLLHARGAIPITESLLIAASSVREDDRKFVRWLLTGNYDVGIAKAVSNKQNYQEIEPRLLARNPDLRITEATLTAVVATAPADIVDLLLAITPKAAITEATLTAAVSNISGNARVVELLLAENPDVKITEVTLMAALSNWKYPMWGVELLLANAHDIEITEAILVAPIASSPVEVTRILKLLLARRPDIEITEAVLMAAVSRGNRGVVRLLSSRDRCIQVTEAVLVAVVSSYFHCTEFLKLLLARNPDVEITEAVLTAAASNKRDNIEMIQLLLDRNSDIKVTKAVMTALTRREEPSDVVVRMLSPRSHSFEVDFPLVMAVADSDWSGELLRFLLARYPNIPTNETELAAAVKSRNHPDLIVGFLLDRDATLKVTEADVIAALEHNYYWVDCLELVELLLARGAELRISEAIAAAAVGCLRRPRMLGMPGRRGIIELLLRRNGIIQLPEMAMVDALSGNLSSGLLTLLLAVDSGTKITPTLLAEVAKTAWGSGEFMQVLLAVGGAIKITEEVLVAAVANETKPGEGPGVAVALMDLFFARNPSLRITETVMVAAAGSFRAVEVLKDLWVRDNTLRVTEAVVVAAAANTSCGPEVIRLLLARNGCLEVTERIVLAAAANSGCGPQVMELLLTREVTTKVTEEIMVAAAANADRGWEVMKLLLTRGEDIKVSERVLMASVAPTHGAEIMGLLLAYDPAVEITKALLMAVARSGNDKTMAHLLDRSPSIELTDAIVKAIVDNDLEYPVGWPHTLSDRHPRYSPALGRIKRAFERRDAARGIMAYGPRSYGN